MIISKLGETITKQQISGRSFSRGGGGGGVGGGDGHSALALTAFHFTTLMHFHDLYGSFWP